MEASSVGLAAAFLAGIVSFLSPCVLPVVPGYISYIAGQAGSATVAKQDARRFAALLLAASFVLGFGVVFVILGASASAIGALFLRHRYETNIAGGIIVVVFGLAMLGAFRSLGWFERDLRVHPRLAGGHPATAFLLGVAFGFGWTPCIGPILGAILTVTAVQTSLRGGVDLLAAYAIGLGVPFLLAALFMQTLLAHIKSLRRAGRPLQTAAGAIMIAFGLVLISGKLTTFSYWLLDAFPVLGRIG
jgi:cytochrome c-type biogenesis protein